MPSPGAHGPEPVLHVGCDFSFPPNRKERKRQNPQQRHKRQQHIDEDFVLEQLYQHLFHSDLVKEGNILSVNLSEDNINAAQNGNNIRDHCAPAHRGKN